MSNYKNQIKKRILNNINSIYENKYIEESGNIFRKKHKLEEILNKYKWEDYKFNKTDRIHVLIGYFYAKHAEKIPKLLDKDLNEELDEFIIGNIRPDLNINYPLWCEIIIAKFFNIPKEIVINTLPNMLDDYLPKIEENLELKINELTTIEDIKYIWPQVKKAQKRYSDKFKIKSIKKEYLNYKRDKRAYELRKKGLTYNKIHKKLLEEGYDSKGYYYIGKILKSYKNYMESK